jgi:hypothetical protein
LLFPGIEKYRGGMMTGLKAILLVGAGTFVLLLGVAFVPA